MRKFRNLAILISLFIGIVLINGCKKEPTLATLTTTAVSNISLTTATSGGNITNTGRADIIARGVCWSTSKNPVVTGSHTSDGAASGSFTSSLTQLAPNTLYYVRAYATNSVGTAYGNEVSFTTNPIAVPTVTTAAVTEFTLTTAVLGGNIVDAGGGTITEGGVCYGLNANPDITSSTKVTDVTALGAFTRNITGLSPGTTYHVRAYAKNSSGPGYGADVTFTTTAVVAPTVTTATITEFTLTTAVVGGNIISAGGGVITEGGVCWSKSANPDVTVATKITDVTALGAFSKSITGLDAGTVYHVRAYARNSAGYTYGEDVQFTTVAPVAPTVTTAAVTTFSYTTATVGGNITDNGGAAITEGGVCWGTDANPDITGANKITDVTSTGAFTKDITGLTAGTIYHVRAYAKNSAGITYGDDVQFTTTAITKPVVTTTEVTNTEVTTASSGGNVTSTGGGDITHKGVCWSISPTPVIESNLNITDDGATAGTFTSSVTGLSGNTTYYLRAYATNSAGTSYGTEYVFKTYAAMDADMNGYYSVAIGTQTWLTENLKTTKYTNGDLIGSTLSDVSLETAPKYQWAYGNNESNVVTYGRLYTWYTATDTRNICPTGWHVPSDLEWTTMSSYLINNGYAFSGPGAEDIGKSLAATSGWPVYSVAGTIGNDQASNNSSGFSALPGGYRTANGTFIAIGEDGHWRSSTESTVDNAWYRSLDFDFAILYRNDYGKRNGYSIRCMKD